LPWFEFESEKLRWFYPYLFVWKSCLLVSWCTGDRCGKTVNNEDHGRSMRLSAEDWGWSNIDRVLSGQTIERSCDAVCGLHHAQGDEEHEFLGLSSKPRPTVSPSLASKSVALGFPVWASKLTAAVW
jgi:hypothetical protein